MNNKPYAITLDVGSSLANKTGSWRTERAVYVDRLPPCNNACPAGENIQAWLYEAEEGEGGYERAWRKVMEDNPFPAIMGRVCYHPCETACNRAQLDEAVGVHSVERFIGDAAIEHGWRVEVEAEPSGKRVLVIGAGPSGLSAAYHLTRLGHAVTIYEAGSLPGGMMRFGIPQYRLPRDVLEAEVGRILDLGVELKLNTQGRERAGGEARGRLRRRLPRRRRPHRPPRLRAGGRGRPHRRRGIAAGEHGGGGAPAARPPRRRLRRRRHGDGRGADGEAARRHRRRRRLPPHPRAYAGPRLRGRGGGGGGDRDALALHRQALRGRQAGAGADGARRDAASRSRPARSRSSRPTRWCWRWARKPTSRCSRACPGSRSRTASSRSGRT